MAGGALSFREDPFRLTPDRRYIFETDGFRRAFAMLLAGIRARRGAMLLTGPSGTGKTTLLQALTAKLQQDGQIVFWRFHPDIPGYDLIGSCLVELDVNDAPTDPAARAQALTTALKARTPSLPAVLIVDEAGQFADPQIAEIASLPEATGGAVQVVLAGLSAVADRLDRDELSAAKQAIVVRAEIGPLARGELGAYIAHRCRVAGQAGPLVFEPAAIGRVFHHTGGTPRLVNRLCATSLFFAEPAAKQISAAVVDEAARACEGDPGAGTPNLPDGDATRHPDATEPTPERPSARAEASEVHRTLAEAERAWIAGATAQAPAAATPAPMEPAAPPQPVAIAEAPAEAVRKPSVLLLEEEAAPAAAVPPPRRSPALRIAASVVIVAGSGAVLAGLLWPTSIGHDYLADSAPVKAISHLLAAEDAKMLPAPAPVVAEAIVPPAAAQVAEPAQPESPKPEPVVATAEPVKPEPAVATPEAILAKPAAAAVPVKAEPVTTRIEPLPEPAPAQPEPIAEVPAPAPAPVTIAAPAAQPEPVAPPPEPVAAAEPATPAPEPAAAEAAATTLSAIEPANGPAPPEPKIEEPPAPAMKPEPPAIVAAIAPPSEPAPAPAAKTEPPPVAAIAPPPTPAPPRTAQASAPAVSPAELQQLMARGDEMMRLADPASARLFYERAAARGLARAYTAVGRTYDPLALQRLNIRVGGANGEQALAWYRRGSDAGDKDAEKAAGDLTAWLARPR